jgi:hypothetical protein
LNACDGQADRQLFHGDSGTSTYAVWVKPCAGELIREGHREARSVGSCDQFIGASLLSSAITDPKVLALRKGSTPRRHNASSVLEIADPNGRSGPLHETLFQAENAFEYRELLVNIQPMHRTALSDVLMLQNVILQVVVGQYLVSGMSIAFGYPTAF